MKGHPSLARRLVLYLVSAEIFVIILGGVFMVPLYVTFNLDNLGLTLDDWAEERAQRLIFNAIVRAPERLTIMGTPELQAYQRRFPDFAFAAFQASDMAALPGSSERLVAQLRQFDRVRLKTASFSIENPGGARFNCAARSQSPLGGPVLTVACNHHFAWDELPFILRDFARSFFLAANSLFYAPLIAASILIASLVVRRALVPLRRAAADAARIDLDSLAQRLPETGMPAEIMPLLSAVNGALTRLDAGVARQRRFTANAAHELRTPIAILRARLDNPEESNLRQDMRRNLRRMRTIVEQLLVVAKLNERENPLDENLDLASALLSLVADYMPLVIESGRFIEFEPPARPVVVRGSRRALEIHRRQSAGQRAQSGAQKRNDPGSDKAWRDDRSSRPR